MKTINTIKKIKATIAHWLGMTGGRHPANPDGDKLFLIITPKAVMVLVTLLLSACANTPYVCPLSEQAGACASQWQAYQATNTRKADSDSIFSGTPTTRARQTQRTQTRPPVTPIVVRDARPRVRHHHDHQRQQHRPVSAAYPAVLRHHADVLQPAKVRS